MPQSIIPKKLTFNALRNVLKVASLQIGNYELNPGQQIESKDKITNCQLNTPDHVTSQILTSHLKLKNHFF